MTFQKYPDLYTYTDKIQNLDRVSNINPHQNEYNWGTVELTEWKSYAGEELEGLIYKPEDFDPTKKYPMIVYFYERNNQTLHNYIPPTPTGSRLNISFYFSCLIPLRLQSRKLRLLKMKYYSFLFGSIMNHFD